MTCPECEVRLAGGEMDGSVETHLRACPACQALSDELRQNALALGAFRDEELGPRPVRKFPGRKFPGRKFPDRKFPDRKFPWMSAVAAALTLALVIPGIWRATRPVAPEPVKATTPAEVTVTASLKAEPLKVKMLTPDPDVVIYWLIDSKEGE
jgi:hypothetical protein